MVSLDRFVETCYITSALCRSIVITERTFDTPVLIRVTKEHHKLICCERLQIRYWKHLRETFSEGFSLRSSPRPDDGIQNFVDILFRIIGGHGSVTTTGLIVQDESKSHVSGSLQVTYSQLNVIARQCEIKSEILNVDNVHQRHFAVKLLNKLRMEVGSTCPLKDSPSPTVLLWMHSSVI